MIARPADRLGHDLKPEFAVGLGPRIFPPTSTSMRVPVDVKGGMAIVMISPIPAISSICAVGRI